MDEGPRHDFEIGLTESSENELLTSLMFAQVWPMPAPADSHEATVNFWGGHCCPRPRQPMKTHGLAQGS